MSEALERPKFKPNYRVETVGSDIVFLLSDKEYVVLSEPLEILLSSLIDGQHTVEEIVDKLQLSLLSPNISIEQVADFFQNAINTSIQARYALMQMEQKGYIIESEDSIPDDLAIFCESLNIDSKEAYQRLQGTKIALKNLGSNLPTSQFTSLLESLHIQVIKESDNSDTDQTQEADLVVVLIDDYLHESLNYFNQQALNSKRPWMLIKPGGTCIWIGPIFVPDNTGCWECLAQRLRCNRPVEGFIQRRKNISHPLTPPVSYLTSIVQTALGIAATEILKWVICKGNPQLEGALITHDLRSLVTTTHILVKRPQCPSCGVIFTDLLRQPSSIILGHRKKNFTAEAGHRCVPPEETLRKYQHHLSPITGVVRELEKVTQAENSISHVYVARHHFLSTFDDLDSLRQNIGGRSAGKGKTELQARTSGFCEAIERYSGIFQGDEIRQKGSYRQLEDKAIHPNICLNFSQEQYQNRTQWNASCSSWFQKVPEPLDEDKEIDWTPIWSLTEEKIKYLPTAYCYYGYPNLSEPYCWADSNGCAAGNTIEEAILQGFMELVERDAVSLWWYNCIRRTPVNLDSFDEPYFQELIQYYQTLGRELWVLDITSDFNIPVFAAISRSTQREKEDIIMGFGAHFEPKLAIGRALTELNQVLPSVMAANIDGSTQYSVFADPLAIQWWETATLANQIYLTPNPLTKHKLATDYEQMWSDDLYEDIMACKTLTESLGLEMLVLDQTRPDIGLKVVKVVVPGLRHWWKRLGPGRLYEVPVKMGWLAESGLEKQLNPYSMWM